MWDRTTGQSGDLHRVAELSCIRCDDEVCMCVGMRYD